MTRSNPLKVCLFDPALQENSGRESSNLGDLIIHEAVDRELRTALGDFRLTRVSSHETPTPELRRELRSCDITVVGGSNILTSEMNKYRQWVISIRHAPSVRNAVLLGVGWWKYQPPPNLYTRIFFRFVLSRRGVHSTRDAYTRQHLATAGWHNVVNTGCPTIWPLDGKNESSFPQRKGDAVLLTLTDFERNPEADKALADLLCREYRQVYVFPQGKYDLEYLAGFQNRWTLLDRDFASFRRFLTETPSVDYIGTRLHGGIFALNHGRRGLILEVDNRAKEMGKDFGLPTVVRTDLERIRAWIDRTHPFQIRLDQAAIGRWRDQFKPLLRAAG